VKIGTVPKPLQLEIESQEAGLIGTAYGVCVLGLIDRIANSSIVPAYPDQTLGIIGKPTLGNWAEDERKIHFAGIIPLLRSAEFVVFGIVRNSRTFALPCQKNPSL
jgi:hypothetical protein